MLSEDLNYFRIKRSTHHATKQREGLFTFHSLAVRAIATSGIVKINYRDNARDEWDRFALQTLGITAAIPFFVVIADDVFDRVRKVDALENVAAHRWVNLHLREFCFGEFARLVQYVLRNGELTDIVKQSACVQCLY